MREVILDTETTGLDPTGGDRIVEIGCVELNNHVVTGETYHQYINPERGMPEEAEKIHGLSEEFLSEKPVMAEAIDGFLGFIGDSPLIIHNSEFDMRFINAELRLLGKSLLETTRAVDTVKLARQKFPGAPASLDALCKRFNIDISSRSQHGALVDAKLLSKVYLELIGKRQPKLQLTSNDQFGGATEDKKQSYDPRPHNVPAEELMAHKAFLEKLKNPIWSS